MASIKGQQLFPDQVNVQSVYVRFHELANALESEDAVDEPGALLLEQYDHEVDIRADGVPFYIEEAEE